MPMKKLRGKAAPASVGDTRNSGGLQRPTRYNERNVNAGGKYVGDAPGLTRDTEARVIKGPGR